MSPRPPADGHGGPPSEKLTNKIKKFGDLQKKSLGMTNDPRFKEIKHFRDGEQAKKHFERLSSKENAQQTKYAFQDPEAELSNSLNPSSIEGRIAWQETFDSTVNRLMVDFSLCDEPECRLNHLDRLYSWFKGHGAKQVRKARASPSFLSVEKNAPAPMGSTRNVEAPLSNTALVLSNNVAMRRSKRMPPAQSMFKPSASKNDTGRKYQSKRLTSPVPG